MSGHPGVPQFHSGPVRDKDEAWLDYAACKGISDPEIFFEPDHYRYAQLICLECTVTQQCGLRRRSGDTGVWGGRVYERRNPRYNRGPVDDHDKDFPHGTERGYKRHLRRGEDACTPCRQAATRNSVDRQHRRKREA